MTDSNPPSPKPQLSNLRSPTWRKIASPLLKLLAVLLVANEIRGIILAGPVLYALWQSGGTLMAYWIAFCSLAGIALSVIVPLWLARKVAQR